MTYDYNEIMYENEDKYEKQILINLNNLIKLFLNYIDNDTKQDILEASNNFSTEELFYFIYDYIFFAKPIYIDIFFSLLKQFNFNFQNELHAITKIFRDCEDEEEKLWILKKYEKSPNIKKITSLEGQLLIDSNKGQFTFTGTKEYFKDNPIVLRYIQNNKLVKHCHQVSHDLIMLLPSGKLITVLIPNEFNGYYYHSVVQDEQGMIIDLANGVVCTEETFYKFYNGLKVESTINKEDMYWEYKAALDEGMPDSVNYYPALLIALHKRAIKNDNTKKMHKS